MKFIVYDIEATCWAGRPPGMVQETIEIGACAVDNYGTVTGSFSKLIKPVIHPKMSHFCQNLTGIEQDSLNRAKNFKRVITEFKEWIGVDFDEYLLASWGDFDQVQLMADCKLHKLDDYWLEEYIDLREQYQQIRKLPKKRGLKSAVKYEGFTWEGTQHEALVDAENTTKIFQALIDEWRY